MSFDKHQIRKAIGDILNRFEGLHSEVAINLLMGTMAQESRFGTYMKQLGLGPALSPYQVEPSTFFWLRDHFKFKYPSIALWTLDDLLYDFRVSTIICRLRYRIVSAPLPQNDVIELAMYWKKWYNTYKGAGTVPEFVANYYKYIL